MLRPRGICESKGRIAYVESVCGTHHAFDMVLAYYANYNTFNKYIRNEDVDDWLIVNQALSAEPDESRWQLLLEAASERVM
jgi:hypothetical protein